MIRLIQPSLFLQGNIYIPPGNIRLLPYFRHTFFALLSSDRQHCHLRRIIEPRQLLLIAPQPARLEQKEIIFLIHSVHVFREPSLVAAVQAAQKRDDNLTSVIVPADHEIHIPDFAGIAEDEAVRAGGKA